MLRALVSWELVGSPMSCALVVLSQPPLAPSSISSALVVGGVRLMNFGTENFNQADCSMKALEFDPDDAPSWYKLGIDGDGRIGTANLTPADWFIKALEIDRNDAPAWYSLGMTGGGRVGKENFTEAGCFIKALEIDPNFAKAWYHLEVLGGGRVGTENSIQAD